ncbi:MAG TPA: uroporphyrinogen-III C-methyltransferase [Candidatus Dormibacteraeota bacterium]|nr:uroporphyrinogen-III C-methyltransferase [Candidatus Dormibacteraeota bacterium]
MSAGAGTVFLVGAGPGDPELITVRGRDLLRAADTVVVDALVSPRLLDELRPECEVHHAGKRAGEHSATQDEINQLLIALARQGKSVVRLKGGDPFVFGRGGEECEALRAAGITYEVVPGVTSAVAAPAMAGIPVTHRDWASHVTVVTGHERDDDDGGDGARVDYGGLAALLAGGTLVFLMGARTLPRIVEALISAGADVQTPVAAVQWGSDPRQRSCTATLSTIVDAVAAARMAAPMVTVVGRVAALGDALAWWEQRPLWGRRILVTRARAQASAFAERLRRLGADAVELPVIATEQVAEVAELAAAIERISGTTERHRWAVFTSANAATLVGDSLRAMGRDARALAGVRVVAIGPETAAALAAQGVRADLVPDEYVAEAVADAMVAQGVDGAYVWLPRAALARDVLPDRLRAAGAEVDVLAVYRTVLPDDTKERLRGELEHGGIDAVTFTSSSTVAHFRAALDGADFPKTAVAACIGPITAQAAETAGYPVAVVAAEYTAAGLAAALAAHFAPATVR